MELYKKNLARLKDIKPDLVERLDNLEINNLEIIVAKNNMPTIQVVTAEKKFYVHSTYNPSREAAQWAETNKVKPGDKLFIFGLGLGYHVQEMVTKAPKDVKFFIVEPNLVFVKAAMKYIDLGYLLGKSNVYCIFGEEEVKFEEFLLEHVGFDNLERIRFTDYSPVVRLTIDYFNTLKQKITKAISNIIIEMNTMLRFSEEWINNLFENIPELIASPGIEQLYGKFQGEAAIIVAAGPSLNKNISMLKQAKGKSLIICVGTALKPMLKAGIRPDLVVSVDGGVANLRHFTEVNHENIPLLFDITIYPEIPRIYKGPKLAGGCHENLLRWIEGVMSERKGLYDMGPSVANMAFDLARRLKCNPIILVGQDLAYTDGKAHATGSAYDYRTIKDFEDRGLFTVEGVDGKPVLTDSIMYAFLWWYENAIKSTEHFYKVIDATEGGAKIPGTQVMTLAEAIKTFCRHEVNAEEKLEKVIKTYKIPEREHIESIIGKLDNLKNQLIDLGNLGEKGVDASEKLLQLYQKGLPETTQMVKVLDELESIDKQIQKHKETTDVFVLMFQKSILRVNQKSKQTNEESEMEKAKRVATCSMELYKGIAEVAHNTLDMVVKAIRRIEIFTDKGVAQWKN
ncbi:MAG: DUF115 domain-containing protein [Clostridia bacterium]|nr:DUF115 domain-containing protein [Clostridia bacterium]